MSCRIEYIAEPKTFNGSKIDEGGAGQGTYIGSKNDDSERIEG
jgi:hypothetical protein